MLSLGKVKKSQGSDEITKETFIFKKDTLFADPDKCIVNINQFE